MELSRRSLLAAGAAGAALVSGCASPGQPEPIANESWSARMHAILDQRVADTLRRSPERCTGLGLSEERAGYRFKDKVSDLSKAAARDGRAALQRSLYELRAINRDWLGPADRVTYDVVSAAWTNSFDSSAFEVGGGAGSPYVVTQLGGIYRNGPNFLDQQHPLVTRDDADAFLARVEGFAGQMDQQTEIIGVDAEAGIIPPDFAIDKAILQLERFTATTPRDSVIVNSLLRRLPQVTEIPEAERASYVERGEALVRDRVFPAYRRQVEALQRIRPRAVHDAGIGRLPRGAEMYAVALRSSTTTTMSPQEIHAIGVELVRQFNSESDAILRQQGLTRGTIAERVQSLNDRPGQLFPNTDAGRQAILDFLNADTRAIEARMPEVFGTLARAQLQIQRVPPFTEAGAPGGYYQRGTIDGSRPGAYFINLRDTSEWPRYTLRTLNYHEGVPGHHWQISIQQESGSIPFIRSAMLGFSAFSEGWGLYAEQLADELGVYADDPLGRIGYLQSMTFRASRLVVDTGIHHLNWTREQAIQSMMEATGDGESNVVTEIERYCVSPGQACSYMVGRQAINQMRDTSRAALGDRFDLKGFHDTMLANGAVPLTVLSQIMSDWTNTQRG
jgi:uncharacterized protein (DUF885 family)